MKITRDIFDAFKRGEKEVFELIFTNYSQSLRRFIFKIIGSDIDSEELMQEVFIKLWENCDKVLSPDSLISYLYTLAKNESFQYLKKRAKNIHVYSDEIDKVYDIEGLSIENDYQAQELALRIMFEVNTMRPQMQKVYKMKFVEELNNDEIAQNLNIKKNSVEILITEVRKQIKKIVFLFLFFSGTQ